MCLKIGTCNYCTVTLAGLEGARFRGFLVQSRMESDQITTVGEFSLTDAGNSRLRPCSTDTVSDIITIMKKNIIPSI